MISPACVKNAAVCGLLLLLVFGCGALAAAEPDPNPPTLRGGGAWPIRRQWTPAETRHYAQWCERLYDRKANGTVEQRTAKLAKLLTDPDMNLLLDPEFLGAGGNPQLPDGVIRTCHSMIDCAKFTAFIPAYYAYRRALPWMTTFVASGERGVDIRISKYNIPVGGANSFAGASAGDFFTEAVGGFISGNYRVNLNGKNAGQTDTVPVALNRSFLMPGCINYLDGHCLVLAKVTEYGELAFLNCSTTQSRDIFSYNGMNTVGGMTPRGSDPDNEWAGCFQGLRVLRYPVAETDASGNVLRVRRRTDEEMKEFGFSTEEYELAGQMAKNQYIQEGEFRPQSLHDLIRLRMKTVDRITPAKFIEAYCAELLDAFAFREQFVQDAWKEVRRNGPIVFPEEQKVDNIFQAKGRWEDWSSPSSDVDRRNKYFYLADWMEYAIRMFGVKPAFVDLTGLERYKIHSQADLAAAFIAEKNRIFAERSMEYTNSRGEKVRLTLADLEKRIYDLSFDPNHPPELRWGAPFGTAERATAVQTVTPVPCGERLPMEESYRLEGYYRCIGQRETDTSYLRTMFTSGYPVRDKLDAQVGKWSYATKPLL